MMVPMWGQSDGREDGSEVEDLLARLSVAEREILTREGESFPRAMLEKEVATGSDDAEKIARMTAIVGTWLNTNTGSVWEVGPLEDKPYSRRFGIGVARESDGSFTPLVTAVEDVVSADGNRSDLLDRLQAFAEFDRRQYLQRS